MNTNKSDIVIVGGGMVGLAMAAALADSKLSICLIEKSDFELLSDNNNDLVTGYLSNKTPLAHEYDIRVSAISPGNQQFLSQFNCWQQLPACRLAYYEKMHVWDGDGGGYVDFDAAELAQSQLGAIVENQVLRAAIYRTLVHARNVKLVGGRHIKFIEHAAQTGISAVPDSVDIGLDDGQLISTKLLIAADGAFSTTRQMLNIDNDESAYHQVAFVINVETEYPHQETAWQRFTHYGPVAFLPLPQSNLCSVVWSIDKNKAAPLMDLTAQDFVDKLSAAFEHKLGRLKAVSEYQGFPLVKRHAHRYLAERCVLIGDAAHTIHPLAGQGVNLGFQDVACLSELILKLHQKNRDFGLKANLRPYERERKAENTMMQEAMSGFKWLFAQQSMPLTLLRNWGMSGVNRSTLIKNNIINRAMGL